MSNDSNPQSQSFIGKVFSNEAAKRGIAGAVTGLLIAAVLELWPTKD